MCLILIQGQVSLAQGSPSNRTPTSSSEKRNIQTLKGVKGPNGMPIDIYYAESKAGEAPKAWAFTEDLKKFEGRLVDIQNKVVEWTSKEATHLPGQGSQKLLPSKIMKNVTWDEQQKENMRKLREAVRNGDQSLIAELQEKQAKAFESKAPGVNAVGRSTQIGIAMYMAMGVLAYLTLATDFPNEPRAWQAYLDSLNDPVGWLMLPAFLVASQWVFKMTKDVGGWKGFMVQNAAMAAGLIASSLLGRMLMDPDLKQCMGIASYRKNGSFERDDEACDRYYNNWSGEELFLTIVPLVGHAVMAGSLISAMTWMFQKGWDVFKLSEKLKIGARFASKSTRGRGLISLVSSAGSMLLFFGAFELSYKIVDLEHSLREFFLVNLNPFSPEKGSLTYNLQDLSANFEVLKKSNFGEFQPAPHCSGRPSDMGPECRGPNLAKMLQANSKLNSEWRQLSHQKVYQSLNSWSIKNQDFLESVVATKQIYRVIFSDLYWERRGEKQPSMMTPEYEGDVKSGARFFFNSLAKKTHKNGNFKEAFPKILLRDNYDFFLASLACGPEAGTIKDQWSFSDTLKEAVSSSTTPHFMIENIHGRDVKFHPPRMVPKEYKNICESPSLYGWWSPTDWLSSAPLPLNYLQGTVKNNRGETVPYKGILQYLVQTLPENFTAGKELEAFNQWWDENIVPSIAKTDQSLEKEIFVFHEELKNDLSSGSARCESVSGTDALQGYTQLILEAGLPLECGARTPLHLSSKIEMSFVEQMALYQFLYLETLKSQGHSIKKIKSVFSKNLLWFNSYFKTLFSEGSENVALLDKLESQMWEKLNVELMEHPGQAVSSGALTLNAAQSLAALALTMAAVNKEALSYRAFIKVQSAHEKALSIDQ